MTADPPRRTEDEPDYRFTLANERTFLAWIRTSLALCAAGIGVIGVAQHFSSSAGRRLLGLAFLALGGTTALVSYTRWRRAQDAMRAGEPLPATRMLVVLGAGMALLALIGVALVIADAVG
jgi:putative membrane protein